MADKESEYVLHTYFRSSCSGRVRIAMNLKGIPYEPITVNIVKGEHKSKDYGEINPLNFLPSLEIKSGPNAGKILTQSVAIMEYLEEKYPDTTSLLPPKSDVAGRALVRALVNVIACDVQPVTNERILKRVAADGGNDKEWAHWLMTDGFAAYERLAAPSAGKFSYGDSITMADICVVPAVWRSARFNVNMDDYPTMKRVFEAMSKEDAVIKAHWKNQPDCPEDLR
jgi:maleylacetoacetate isomerase